VNSGVRRFTFGLYTLSDRIELVALAMGLFGVAEFLLTVNRLRAPAIEGSLRWRDMRPSRAELRQSFMPMVRGTLVGTLFGALPGTGPTITTFIAYALERRVSRTPERFGHGALEGVAAPEAASHSKTQIDFIPTMTMGIPGDAVMAMLLGALVIQGVQPGPALMRDHADLCWGLIASFWIGNVLLIVLNVPLIGLWVRLLRVPHRLMFPAALFFIAIGVYSNNNEFGQVYEVLFFGAFGAVFSLLDFPLAPILLGFVLGPLVEANFRRSALLSQGDLTIFITRPISACVLALCLALVLAQAVLAMLGTRRQIDVPATEDNADP
jgi:putative tricarboxylic transport membrane protein